MGSFRRFRDIFIVVILLALPFFFLRASVRAPEEMTVVDRYVMRASATLQYFGAALGRNVSSLVSDYAYLVDVKQDNNQLAYENARLRKENRELRALRGENKRLRGLLSLRETIPDDTVSALVIAKDTTEYFRVAGLVLDNPKAPVRPDMPVVSIDGAVGTVLRVAGERVDVRLVVDSGFGVDVVVERTQARGFVRGTGDNSSYTARVEYMQRTDEVEVGDLLLTSGLGCRFPPGLPVGRIKKIKKRDFGIYQSVELEPTVDYSRLESVLIVLRDTKGCTEDTKKKRGAKR